MVSTQVEYQAQATTQYNDAEIMVMDTAKCPAKLRYWPIKISSNNFSSFVRAVLRRTVCKYTSLIIIKVEIQKRCSA